MAPAVAYLFLSVVAWKFSGGVLLNGMPSLAKAAIVLHSNKECGIKFDDNQFKSFWIVCPMWQVYIYQISRQWFGLLSLLTLPFHTNYVVVPFSLLSTSYTIHSRVINEEFTEFQSLRSTELEDCDLSDNFHMLGHFLQHSPNLEKLTLRCCKVYCALPLKLLSDNLFFVKLSLHLLWCQQYSKDHKKKKGKAKFEQGVPEPVWRPVQESQAYWNHLWRWRCPKIGGALVVHLWRSAQ